MATIDSKTVESINNELIQQMQSEPIKLSVEWPIDETIQSDKHKKKESKNKTSKLRIDKTMLISREHMVTGAAMAAAFAVAGPVVGAIGFLGAIMGSGSGSSLPNLSFKDVNEIYGQAIKEDMINASKENKTLK